MFVAHNVWAVDLEPRTLHCFTVPMEGSFIGETHEALLCFVRYDILVFYLLQGYMLPIIFGLTAPGIYTYVCVCARACVYVCVCVCVCVCVEFVCHYA